MSPETAPIRHHKVNATKEESRKTRKQFLQQLGLKTSDADIIEYFVSVVEKQQLEEYFVDSNLSNAGEPVRVEVQHKLCLESICKPKIPY
jgi:hypothetical protein